MNEREITSLFVGEAQALLPPLAQLIEAGGGVAPEERDAAIRACATLASLCEDFRCDDCATVARAARQVIRARADAGRMAADEVAMALAQGVAYLEERFSQLDRHGFIAQPDATTRAEGGEVVRLLTLVAEGTPLEQAAREAHAAREAAARDAQPDRADLPDQPSPIVPHASAASEDDILRQFRSASLLRPESQLPQGLPPTATDGAGDVQRAAFGTDTPDTLFIAAPDMALLDEIPPEVNRLFIAETLDDVQDVRSALVAVEHGDISPETLADMQRVAHKVKGAAATLGYVVIAELAHAFEDMLKAAARAVAPARHEVADALMRCFALLQAAIDAAAAELEPPADLPARAREIIAAFAAATRRATGAPVPADGATPRRVLFAGQAAPDISHIPTGGRAADHLLRVDVQRMGDLVDAVGELAVNRGGLAHVRDDIQRVQHEIEQALDRLSDVSDQVADLNPVIRSASGVGLAGWAAAPDRSSSRAVAPFGSSSGQHHEWDELELDRYTEFDHALRSLTESVADVTTLHGNLRSLINKLGQLGASQEMLMEQIQRQVDRVRLVPMTDVVARVELAARILAGDLGKPLALDISGEMTEIDRGISDALTEPLVQLARNAVLHGIEPPDERAAAGKPREGHLWLHASCVANEVLIEIGDDGRGVNPHRLVASALAMNVLTPEESRTIGREEALDLMFTPGLSTVDTPSVHAGRGVGLDEVRTAIRRLKGSVSVQSDPGRGSTFRISVPISLSSVRVLQVRAEGQGYAIPFSAVERTVALSPAELLVTIEPAAPGDSGSAPRVLSRSIRLERTEAPLAPFDGSAAPTDGTTPAYEEIPVLALAELFGRTYDHRELYTGVVVWAGRRRVALLVDGVQDERDLVVRALPPHLRRRGVRAATVAPDGQVLLLLDVAELAAVPSSRPVAARPPVARPRPDEPPRVLVVDDSVSIRRAMELALTRAGFVVDQARDGIEALGILIERPPRVVLLDVEMPRLDGYELLGVLRGTPHYAGIRVAMLTSRAGEKHRDYALALGADAYLVKPCPQDQILETVRALLVESAGTE